MTMQFIKDFIWDMPSISFRAAQPYKNDPEMLALSKQRDVNSSMVLRIVGVSAIIATSAVMYFLFKPILLSILVLSLPTFLIYLAHDGIVMGSHIRASNEERKMPPGAYDSLCVQVYQSLGWKTYPTDKDYLKVCQPNEAQKFIQQISEGTWTKKIIQIFE